MKNARARTHTSEYGNVLFLILIAVVLFATLSFVITNSDSGGNLKNNKEQLLVEAAQLRSYFNDIKMAIDRMKIISGCSDTDITFYSNPAKPECGIFSPEGGGIKVSRLPYCCGTVYPPLKNYDIPASNNVCGGPNQSYRHLSLQKLWIKGVGQDYEQDLVMIACNIPDELCTALNAINVTDGTQYSAFTGSYNTTTSDPYVTQVGFRWYPPEIVGKREACISSGSSKRYYQVVLVR